MKNYNLKNRLMNFKKSQIFMFTPKSWMDAFVVGLKLEIFMPFYIMQTMKKNQKNPQTTNQCPDPQNNPRYNGYK